jgi:succinoglycan biosynthesis transport protein ExoP
MRVHVDRHGDRHGAATVQDNSADFRDYLRVLSRRRWLVVLCVLLGIGGGLAAGEARGPAYTSHAEVVIQPIGVSITGAGLDSASGVNVPTQQQVAGSAGVAELVRKRAQSQASTSQLLAGLSITAPAKSNVLTFSYTADKPEKARILAQAFAESYLELRRTQGTETIERLTEIVKSRLTAVETQLDKVQDSLADAPKGSTAEQNATALYSTLSQQAVPLRNRLDELSTLVVDPGTVIMPASLPTRPDGFTLTEMLVSGALIGLLLGTILAFLRDRIDDRLRGPDDISRWLRLPTLAAIPSRPRRGQLLLRDPSSAPEVAKAYGLLAARLMVAARRTELTVITVTAPSDSRDSQIVAANLSLALVRAGNRVALEGIATEAPLRDQLDTIAHRVPVEQAVEGAESSTHVPGLVLVTAPGDGANPVPNPEVTRGLSADLRGRADFVIVSAPPVLTAADGLLLSSVADGVLLVGRERSTPRAEVAEAATHLIEIGANLLGVVVTGPGRRGAFSRPKRRSRQTDAAAARRVEAVPAKQRLLQE